MKSLERGALWLLLVIGFLLLSIHAHNIDRLDDRITNIEMAK